jgi:hypothetical protein
MCDVGKTHEQLPPVGIGFFIDTRHDIGAARGQKATCVCFDVNQTDVHACPVTENEAKIIMGPGRLTITKSSW